MKKIVYLSLLLFMSFTVVSQKALLIPEDTFNLGHDYLPIHRTLKCFGDEVWAGMSYGEIMKYNVLTDTYQLYDEDICTQFGIVGENILPLHYDGDTLWFSYEWSGIKYYVKSTNTLHDVYSNTPVRDVVYSNGDIYFCSSSEKNVYHFNNGQLTVYNSSNSNLPDSIPMTIALDEDGDLWVAYDGVLGVLDGSQYTRYNMPFISNYNYTRPVRRMVFDKNGDVWIASHGSNIKDLVRFDGSSFYYYDQTNSSLPNLAPADIAIDTNDGVWFVDGLGFIYKYDYDLNNFITYDMSVQGPRSIDFDRKGNLWIASVSGWYVFNETEIQGYLSSEEQVNVDINVYPNPTEDVFKVTSEQLFTEVSVHDINGRRLNHAVFQDTFSKMLSFDLSKGIYFIEIKQDGITLATKRLVVK